jgi:hypothetical protein
LCVASSAGISPEKSGGEKKFGGKFFSKPIHRLKPIERPAEDWSLVCRLVSHMNTISKYIQYYIKVYTKTM